MDGGSRITADDAGRGSLWNLWPVAGKLEANVDRLLEGQTQLKADLKDTNDRIDRKFDRLMYAVVALTTGVIGLLIIGTSEPGWIETDAPQWTAGTRRRLPTTGRNHQPFPKPITATPNIIAPTPPPRATGREWKLAVYPYPNLRP